MRLTDSSLSSHRAQKLPRLSLLRPAGQFRHRTAGTAAIPLRHWRGRTASDATSPDCAPSLERKSLAQYL